MQDLERAEPEKTAEPRGTEQSFPRQSFISKIRLRLPGQAALFTHPMGHLKSNDETIVDFDGPDDLYCPINWSFRKKALTTILYGLSTMGATWASSIYSPAIPDIMNEFLIGEITATLGTSLLLYGFELGPVLWAPLSELYGRKKMVFVPYFISAIFSFATAVSKDIQTVMITRFFAGFFGGAPITNVGGVLADIWSPEQRGAAMAVYGMALVGGPVLGPIAGGAIVDSHLGWRWTEYVSRLRAFSLICTALC
ncbi:unnamed protein product [Penicillium salamii]|uniref:Major facilitator superfamily (MFS) profile domain-containing protein n=1 Tax=Penicillium salamii TaxID=1612424 RepID=A0A9W4J796_9EURO|nr:unnamed protein product [Penicillium salamii]